MVLFCHDRRVRIVAMPAVLWFSATFFVVFCRSHTVGFGVDVTFCAATSTAPCSLDVIGRGVKEVLFELYGVVSLYSGFVTEVDAMVVTIDDGNLFLWSLLRELAAAGTN